MPTNLDLFDELSLISISQLVQETIVEYVREDCGQENKTRMSRREAASNNQGREHAQR